SHRPRLLLSSIWLESRDPEGAVTELRLLAAEFPQEWEVWQALGIALEVMAQYPDAEQAFLKALAERSEEPQSLFHLALAQMGQTHWETAQATLRRLLQRDESHGQGWLHLGVVETRLERWNDAARAFEQAMQLNPESEKARAGLSLAQSKLSR
ncbi:MAG: tetratricopeptide repeat protein, partial [SAR324 cluster bacterium]|nr:tetratricopeptide repeat protein [SAR324 cluster bacterium]